MVKDLVLVVSRSRDDPDRKGWIVSVRTCFVPGSESMMVASAG